MKYITLILLLLTLGISSCKKDQSVEYSQFYLVTLTPQPTATSGVVKLRGEILSTGQINVSEYGFSITGNDTSFKIPVSTSGVSFNKQFSVTQALNLTSNYTVAAYAYQKSGDSTFLKQGNFQAFVPGNVSAINSTVSFSTVSTNLQGGGLCVIGGIINNPQSYNIVEYGVTCFDQTNSANSRSYVIFQAATPNTTPTISVNYLNDVNPFVTGEIYSVQIYVIVSANGTNTQVTSAATVINP